jgi:hypothetical protein
MPDMILGRNTRDNHKVPETLILKTKYVRNYEWQERRKLQAERLADIKLQSLSFKILQVEERMCIKVSYFIVYDLSLWAVYWSKKVPRSGFLFRTSLSFRRSGKSPPFMEVKAALPLLTEPLLAPILREIYFVHNITHDFSTLISLSCPHPQLCLSNGMFPFK